MTIYLCLVGYILLLPLLCHLLRVSAANREKRIAFWGMLGIFLVLALKAPSVGVDIEGYRNQYFLAKRMPWTNFDYVYFERGYILLNKIFAKMGVDFQFFAAMIYGFSSLSWYKLISKYSKDACLSLLYIVCFQFFVFSASGLRQTVAMAICAFAFMEFDKKSIVGKVFGFLLMVVAVTMHQSAYIFVLVPFIMLLSEKKKRINILSVLIVFWGAFLMRGSIWTFVNLMLKKVDVDAQMALGGAFLFQVFILLFSICTFMYYYKTENQSRLKPVSANDIAYEDALTVRFTLYAPACYLILSGGVLLRSAMYITMFITVFITQMMEKYNSKGRMILKTIFIVVLIYIFYTETLAVNQLGICPYKFFWE